MERYQLSLRDKPIRDIVYDYLKKAICRGDLSDGERVAEEDLANRLKVSRTPIREALRKLEVEGLVKHYPRRGVLVKHFSRQEYLEIYQIRLVLEQIAVPYIVANITKSELEQLWNIYESSQLWIENRQLQKIFECEDEFNEIIVKACISSRIGPLLEAQYIYLHRLRKETHQISNRRKEAWEQHLEIIQALERRDINLTREVFLNHTKASMQAFQKEQDGIQIDEFFSQVEGVV